METQTAITRSGAQSVFAVENFETSQRVALMLTNTDLVPPQYRATSDTDRARATANCMIALDMANRLCVSPLMVMQNLYIVQGRPSWSSKFLIATVNMCGRFEPLQYEFRDKGKIGTFNGRDYKDLHDIECVAHTTKRGGGERLASSPVSIRLAIHEGWYTKNGSKWQTMPQKMLRYRAASFWTNEFAPEISMGIYTQEESEDMGEALVDGGDGTFVTERQARLGEIEARVRAGQARRAASKPKDEAAEILDRLQDEDPTTPDLTTVTEQCREEMETCDDLDDLKEVAGRYRGHVENGALNSMYAIASARIYNKTRGAATDGAALFDGKEGDDGQ